MKTEIAYKRKKSNEKNLKTKIKIDKKNML